MKTGSLVSFQGKLWRVERRDTHARMSQLWAWDGSTIDVPDDLDSCPNEQLGELTIYADPASDWPFVASPLKHGAGPVVKLLFGTKELQPLRDWVASSRLRQGGSIFLNPKLGLRRGHTLTAVHKTGRRTKVVVTGMFGTIQRRRARSKPSFSSSHRSTSTARALLHGDPFGEDT